MPKPRFSNLNLLLANNGYGKTSLLKAIALTALGPAVGRSGIYPYRLIRREAGSMARLDADEERIVLLAMHQALVERALCLREYTPAGTLLIFPSYYRRERKELTGHPAVLVTYRFHGFLDDIYATLVVRLHHSQTCWWSAPRSVA